eukprot:gnl/TRDRNA2_/TRDRNA2_200020_c0_seq1.p1 gnl/TRDRNA2_/TRDRNA2_200020_c0~~gnl/TRDRNA2_/TRDRNA2_200020_c0_seq1.p1  ORF type:complete len:439 (+),score=93.32 gnl/TRDRNA2_/TRDRNA2_200020_c0_seq1:44-1360(+)
MTTDASVGGFQNLVRGASKHAIDSELSEPQKEFMEAVMAADDKRIHKLCKTARKRGKGQVDHLLEAIDSDGWSVLHFAAQREEPDEGMLRELLKVVAEVRASVNIKEPEKGRTPLHIAAQFSTPDAIDLLLAAGADRSLRDIDGFEALELANGLDRKRRLMDPEQNVKLLMSIIRRGLDRRKKGTLSLEEIAYEEDIWANPAMEKDLADEIVKLDELVNRMLASCRRHAPKKSEKHGLFESDEPEWPGLVELQDTIEDAKELLHEMQSAVSDDALIKALCEIRSLIGQRPVAQSSNDRISRKLSEAEKAKYVGIVKEALVVFHTTGENAGTDSLGDDVEHLAKSLDGGDFHRVDANVFFADMMLEMEKLVANYRHELMEAAKEAAKHQHHHHSHHSNLHDLILSAPKKCGDGCGLPELGSSERSKDTCGVKIDGCVCS